MVPLLTICPSFLKYLGGILNHLALNRSFDQISLNLVESPVEHLKIE